MFQKLKAGAHVNEDNLKKMDDSLQWMNTEMEDLLKIKLLGMKQLNKEDLYTQQLYAEISEYILVI